MNSNPKDILKFWTSVEKFIPFEVKTEQLPEGVDSIQKEVLADQDIPWLNTHRFGHSETKTHSWVYTVFIGILDYDFITSEIKRLLNVDAPNYNPGELKNLSCIASFQVTLEGKPIFNSFKIPDYFIGVASLAKYGVNDKEWLEKGDKVIRSKMLDSYLNFQQYIKGIPGPASFAELKRFLDDLIKLSSWDAVKNNVKVHNTAVIYSSRVALPKAQENQEKGDCEEEVDEKSTMISSFYIKDLEAINGLIKEGDPENSDLGLALRQYVNIHSCSKPKEDVCREKSYAKKYCDPSLLPPARWPGKGDFPLNLAQQMAVNLAFKKDEGIFSVNGPPGTGKTTLLRDIISNIIVKRAEVLAKLKNPNEAFHNPTTIKIGNYHYKVWDLIEGLKGHEIFIASSNNGAVENISKEIPLRDEVDTIWNLDYFADIASNAIGEECWGLGSAALGNKKNISSFFNRFWDAKPRDEKDGNVGLEHYLKNLKNKMSWQETRKAFLHYRELFNEHQKNLINISNILDEIGKDQQEIKKLETDLDNAKNLLVSLKNEKTKIEETLDRLREKVTNQKELLSSLKAIEPSIIAKFMAFLGFPSSYHGWKKENKQLSHELYILQKTYNISLSALEEQSCMISNLEAELIGNQEKLKNCGEKLALKQVEIEKFRKYIGNNFPDDEFWQKPEQELQLLSPWMHQILHHLRGKIFVEAMNLHKAFIHNTAERLMNNLRCMNYMVRNSLPKKYNITELTVPIWASFFLVVPTVSTTFASFSNFCSNLDKEKIGWLLIVN